MLHNSEVIKLMAINGLITTESTEDTEARSAQKT